MEVLTHQQNEREDNIIVTERRKRQRHGGGERGDTFARQKTKPIVIVTTNRCVQRANKHPPEKRRSILRHVSVTILTAELPRQNQVQNNKATRSNIDGNSLALTRCPTCDNLRIKEGTTRGEKTILCDNCGQLESTNNKNVARRRQRRVIQAIFLPGNPETTTTQRKTAIQLKSQSTIQQDHLREPFDRNPPGSVQSRIHQPRNDQNQQNSRRQQGTYNGRGPRL